MVLGFAVTDTFPSEAVSLGSMVLGTRKSRTLVGGADSRSVVAASLSLSSASARAVVGRIRLRAPMETRVLGFGRGLSMRGFMCVAFAVVTLFNVLHSQLTMD